MAKQQRSNVIWTRHINPSGELGGVVAESAHVGEGAFIADTAVVLPDGRVGDGQHVDDGCVVAGNDVLFFGKVSQ